MTPHEEALRSLTETLEYYKRCNISEIMRSDLGEKLSFESAEPYIQRIVNIYLKLSQCDLSDLPNVTMNQISQCGRSKKSILENIQMFAPERASNPFGERADLIDQIRNRWEHDFPTISPVLAYATKSSADFLRLEREARGTLSELSDSKTQFKSETDDILRAMNSALGEVQNAAKEAGVSQHATHFSEEADQAKLTAIISLIASVLLGLTIISYVVFHIEPIILKIESPTGIQLIQAAMPRLLIVFVLSFGMVWAAKNFTSAAHNYVINRHRKNALASFQTFVEGASKQEVKDVVLLQATHAIFTPQDSGFAKGEIPNPSSQVVEVFRNSGNR